MDLDPTALVARWGYAPEGNAYNWDDSCNLWVPPFYGGIRLIQDEHGWRAIRPASEHDAEQTLSSEAFSEPWLAAQDVASRMGLPVESISKKQFEMLTRIGAAYQHPWTQIMPWNTPLPWFEGMTPGWLQVGARLLPPEVLESIPHRNRTRRSAKPFRSREFILIADEFVVHEGDLEIVVNPRGEVTIDLIQASPAYRHWSQLHEGLKRCGDLPASHDLLLAALPPQPEVGQELAAWVRIVQGDLEFRRFAEIPPGSVAALRAAIMATTDPKPKPTMDPVRLRLAERFGEVLEAQLPNYHPDMDLWSWLRTDPEIHYLMWRGRRIGECTGPSSFEFLVPIGDLSKEALRTWISGMCPTMSEEVLDQLLDTLLDTQP